MSLPTLPSHTIAGWMLYALLIGGVITLAALAAHDAQRAANRAVRWVWFGAIIGIVALSAAAPWRRAELPSRIAMPASVLIAEPDGLVRRTTPTMTIWLSRARVAVLAPFSVVLQTSQRQLERLPLDAQRALGAGWLLASVVTIGVFAASYRRTRRRMQQWPIQRVDDVSARVSPTVGPAVMGLAPSEIIVPAWLLQRPREEQRLVIAHESEHVRAGDPWLLVLACGAVALMPWHPALWFALGRLRLAIELDCDRRVMRQGIPAASYGALLIDLSALRTALPSAMPAFSCSGSYLERRLVAMTARRSRFSASRRALGALIAMAAIATACESKMPTSAEINAMDATTAAAKATEVALVDESRATYLVDDKEVTRATAKAIPADEIAEVRIVGKSLAGTSTGGEIRLRTKQALARLPHDSAEMTKVPGVMMLRKRADGDSLTVTAPRVSQRQPYKKQTFNGLLVVDGQVVESSTLDRMNPESIETIEVVKGEAAKTRYADPRAANGVIVVITKAKK